MKSGLEEQCLRLLLRASLSSSSVSLAVSSSGIDFLLVMMLLSVSMLVSLRLSQS